MVQYRVFIICVGERKVFPEKERTLLIRKGVFKVNELGKSHKRREEVENFICYVKEDTIKGEKNVTLLMFRFLKPANIFLLKLCKIILLSFIFLSLK